MKKFISIILLQITRITTILEWIVGFCSYRAIYNYYPFEQIGNIRLPDVQVRPHYRSAYQIINIWEYSSIVNLINNIYQSESFKSALKKYELSGVSADHFVDYTNLHIPYNTRNLSYYAELPHFDKTFSFNTLKLFILVSKVDESSGPFHYLSELLHSDNIDNPNLVYKKFCGSTGDMLLGSASRNPHFAGIPDLGKERRQIMIQFNPSNENKINQRIFFTQTKKEINFPFFRKILYALSIY